MSHLKGKEGGNTQRGVGVGDVGRFLRCVFYSKVGFCNIMNVNVFSRWMVAVFSRWVFCKLGGKINKQAGAELGQAQVLFS